MVCVTCHSEWCLNGQSTHRSHINQRNAFALTNDWWAGKTSAASNSKSTSCPHECLGLLNGWLEHLSQSFINRLVPLLSLPGSFRRTNGMVQAQPLAFYSAPDRFTLLSPPVRLLCQQVYVSLHPQGLLLWHFWKWRLVESTLLWTSQQQPACRFVSLYLRNLHGLNKQ